MSEIAIREVRRSYGQAHALDRVSFTAEAGKVLALLGPSGSGKSTLLRLIAGLEPVDSGTIHVDGELLSSSRLTIPAESRRMGVVFQDYALFPHLSAAENVAFGLAGGSRAERERSALAWLDRVGLKSRAAAYPHELSGGEQQRVALARALAPKPRAVLLDEPFSGLDNVLRSEMRDATLQMLGEAKVTTLFVTHDAEDALQAADKLVLLKAGRVLQEASPRDVYDSPASLDVAATLGPINVHAGRISDGAALTPFGAISTPRFPDGAPVQVAVRAESVRLTPGSMARVLSVRPHGAHDLVRIETQGEVWRVLAPARTSLGERVDVSIDPRGAFVFEL